MTNKTSHGRAGVASTPDGGVGAEQGPRPGSAPMRQRNMTRLTSETTSPNKATL